MFSMYKNAKLLTHTSRATVRVRGGFGPKRRGGKIQNSK
uniref:Uncharacterized protein n=1 Tax=Anguilla anguilla TaxID=7936 RepID=A0A0E9V7V3_ANGAN